MSDDGRFELGDEEVWPDALTTLALLPPPIVPPPARGLDAAEPVDLSSEPARDPDDPEWAHVDLDHPAPWLGCVRRGLCCRSNPGWFAPGEAEKAAELLDLPMADLVNRYLVIDHVDTTWGRVEVFAPAKLTADGRPVERTGQRTSDIYSFSTGVCVFFDGRGCGIYEARPTECRQYVCTNLPEDNASRPELATLWPKAAEDS